MGQTLCVVSIDGQDVSSNILPRLLQLSVSDKAGGSSDTCQIDLDDTDGQILLPSTGAQVTIELGNAGGVDTVFVGTVDEVKSSGSRSSGMTLSISAKGVDTTGKAKEQQQKHWDNQTVGTVMQEAGKLAGISDVQVASALSSIQRVYVAMQNESFLHFGQRIAREVGGTFKVVGTKAILAERNAGASVGGEALSSVTAARGDNLISWDIAPELGRPRYKQVKVRHYDTKTATWKEEIEQIADQAAQATAVDRHVAGDQEDAKARAKSHKKDAEREKGGGSVTIDGSTAAQPEGTLVLSGARDGIDGTYRIDSVNHSVSRNGWTTQLEVKQPQGDAGTDSRSG